MVLKLRAHQRLGAKPALSWLQLRDKFFEFVRPAAALPHSLRAWRCRAASESAVAACGRHAPAVAPPRLLDVPVHAPLRVVAGCRAPAYAERAGRLTWGHPRRSTWWGCWGRV